MAERVKATASCEVPFQMVPVEYMPTYRLTHDWRLFLARFFNTTMNKTGVVTVKSEKEGTR